MHGLARLPTKLPSEKDCGERLRCILRPSRSCKCRVNIMLSLCDFGLPG